MIEAPDSLNSFHPICIENAFSGGSVLCPFRINSVSAARRTPGVLIGALPFGVDENPGACFPPTFSAAKFSNSERECPDTLESKEPPCMSSPTHKSCAVSFTENISGVRGPRLRNSSRWNVQLQTWNLPKDSTSNFILRLMGRRRRDSGRVGSSADACVARMSQA